MTVANDESCEVSLGPHFPEDEDGKRRKLDFLGYLPCPIRAQVRDAIHAQVSASPRGEGFAWYVPGGCNSADAYENLYLEDSLDAYPELIASLGFGDFFRPRFRQRFIDSGLFEAPHAQAVDPRFADCGIVDPKGRYTIYGAFPYVILADLGRLGGRRLPERWAELLDPAWKGEIVLGGGDDEVSDVILRFIFRDHGMEGVRALSRNVKSLMHASKMAKLAGSGDPASAALFVLPYFFADTCPRREETRIHVPAEGALTSPLYVIGKKSRSGLAREMEGFLLGSQVAYQCRKAFFPTLASQSPLPGQLDPQTLPLRWIGWDFIEAQDLSELNDRCEAEFLDERGRA